MDVYKLTPSSIAFKKIDRTAFEADTQRRAPWYQPARSGEMSQFAVCPACDNPIQIIGLYRLPERVAAPYGRHTGESVPNLAKLDPGARDACPYFKPKRHPKSARKPHFDNQARKILHLLIDQFDRVVYLLGKQTGIWLSKKRLEDMLDTYRQMKGFMYMGATPINVPWVFAYMSNSFPLFYQKISDNAALSEAIRKKIPHARIDDHGRLIARRDSEGKAAFISVNACFIHHAQSRKSPEGALSETMKLVISTQRNGSSIVIHEETVVFDHQFFQRLITKPDSGNRRYDLVEFANARLGDLLN